MRAWKGPSHSMRAPRARSFHLLEGFDRAAVVTAALSAEHEELLDRSAWARCSRHSVLPASGHHEAAGGFALCSAAALIGSGAFDEALALGGSGAVLWITRFSRARARADEPER